VYYQPGNQLLAPAGILMRQEKWVYIGRQTLSMRQVDLSLKWSL
jgi:hypothetical protein